MPDQLAAPSAAVGQTVHPAGCAAADRQQQMPQAHCATYRVSGDVAWPPNATARAEPGTIPAAANSLSLSSRRTSSAGLGPPESSGSTAWRLRKVTIAGAPLLALLGSPLLIVKQPLITGPKGGLPAQRPPPAPRPHRPSLQPGSETRCQLGIAYLTRSSHSDVFRRNVRVPPEGRLVRRGGQELLQRGRLRVLGCQRWIRETAEQLSGRRHPVKCRPERPSHPQRHVRTVRRRRDGSDQRTSEASRPNRSSRALSRPAQGAGHDCPSSLPSEPMQNTGLAPEFGLSARIAFWPCDIAHPPRRSVHRGLHRQARRLRHQRVRQLLRTRAVAPARRTQLPRVKIDTKSPSLTAKNADRRSGLFSPACTRTKNPSVNCAKPFRPDIIQSGWNFCDP